MIYDVELFEPARPLTADTTEFTADSTAISADAISLPAVDFVDAKRKAAAGGGIPWRDIPRPVVGAAYGVLPRLIGEAHGVVGVAGAGAVVLPISGEARGETGDDLVELMLILLAA